MHWRALKLIPSNKTFTASSIKNDKKVTLSKPAFTCSKSTTKILEQSVKSVQIYQQRPQSDSNGILLVDLLFLNFKKAVHIVVVFLLFILNN